MSILRNTTTNIGGKLIRLQTTGFGSTWTKWRRNQRTCPECGSLNLIFPDKFNCVCQDCGFISPKRLRKFKETKVKPLTAKIEEKRELRVIFEGKTRGIIRGERYISHRNKLHFCRKYVSFGISKEIFDYLGKMNITQIVIIYTKVDDTQEVYYSDINAWRNFGIYDKLGGFEVQLFLPIKYMRAVG